MPNEERGRLDNAIDRAVRGMMQVDPPPGLRHRVSGRLGTTARRTWMVPAFATALAAAVVLILAVVLLRVAPVAPAPEPQLASAPPAVPPELPPHGSSTAPRSEPVATATPPPQQPQTTRPNADSIFGEKTGRVSAANVRQDVQEKPKPADQAATPKAEAPGQPVNIKLDLTFTDQTGSSEPVRKVVSMLVADRGVGSIRNGGSVRNQGRVQIHVNARPQILESGAIRLTLTLEYTPRAQSTDGPAESSALNEQITTIIEPGKPVVISQAADPASDRRITVEVRAALMK